MTWMRFSHGYRRDPAAEGSPQALVALLHDLDASAGMLVSIATGWVTAVPTTAFLALDAVSGDLRAHAMREFDGRAARAGIDQASQPLKALLEHQLRFWRLDTSRLVLVGFGYGGTVALNLVLQQGQPCAGVLAFAAKLTRPLPRLLRVAQKVRLIGCAGEVGPSTLRDDVALLTARGIDARGVLLSGSALSQEAIRYGGAYLVELVATAQRGDRFHSTGPMRSSTSNSRI